MRIFLGVLCLVLMSTLSYGQKSKDKKTDKQKAAEEQNEGVPIQKLVKDFEKEVEAAKKDSSSKKKKKKKKKRRKKGDEPEPLQIFDTDKKSTPIEEAPKPKPKAQRKVMPKLKLNESQIAEYSFYGMRPEKDIQHASLNVSIPASKPGKLDIVRYEKALELVKYGFHDRALALFLRIHQSEPQSSNINYWVGYCYLMSYDDRTKSIPYFKKAMRSINRKYNAKAAAFEDNAPIQALYYLAWAHHLNGEIKQAQRELKIFLDVIDDKHDFYAQAKLLEKQLENHSEIGEPHNYGIQNAGNAVNSVYADYGAVPVGSDRTIYFTSHRIKPDQSNANVVDYFEGRFEGDIYRAEFNSMGHWQEPEIISISLEYDERVAAVTSAEDHIYYHIEDKVNKDLYKSTFAFGDWQLPYELFPQTFTADWDERFAVNFDGTKVIFASNRKGGFGGYDLYYTQIEPNGDWSEPLNLGEKINSKHDERYPFFHPNGEVLYFSHNGEKSIGGHDVFMSKKDPFGEWLDPINMGLPVNSASDDTHFSINTDGSKGYVSRQDDKNGAGDLDLFVINFLGKSNFMRPEISGGFDMSIPLEEGTDFIEITNLRTSITDVYRPNVRNGKVQVSIDPCTQYQITYKNKNVLIRKEEFLSPCDFDSPGKSVVFNPLDNFEITESTEFARSRARPDQSPQFTDPNALNYSWQVLKNGKPYKGMEGTEVNYLNKDGYIMHKGLLDASGRFDFHLIPLNENYIFEMALGSSENCNEFSVILLRNYTDLLTEYTFNLRCFEK